MEVEEPGVTDRVSADGSSRMLSLRSFFLFLDSVCSNIAACRAAKSQMLAPLDGLRKSMIIFQRKIRFHSRDDFNSRAVERLFDPGGKLMVLRKGETSIFRS